MKPIERKSVALKSKTKVIHRVGAGEKAPNFDSILSLRAQPPSSLQALEDTGDPEQNVNNELSEVLRAIQTAKKERRDAYRVLTDNNFYAVVCFQSEAQRDEFLVKSGWAEPGTRFINGLKVAERIGVEIIPINLKAKTNRSAPVLLRTQRVIGEPESAQKGGEQE